MLIINIYYSRKSVSNKEFNNRHFVWHLVIFNVMNLATKDTINITNIK